MMRFMFAGMVALACSALGLAGDVVVPKDKTPFTVQEGDIVRIAAKGIAGTQVTAKVTGPGKETVNSVSTRVNGRLPIGPGDHEVEVKTSGKGKVVVEITIKPPTGEGTTETYEFTVK